MFHQELCQYGREPVGVDSGESVGWLAVIDIATGRIHKRIDCPDEMFFGSYPTFYGDKMYIMGLPNYLYCYSVDKMER